MRHAQIKSTTLYTLLALLLISPAFVFGQDAPGTSDAPTDKPAEQTDRAEKRKTVEPVFRVSKLNESDDSPVVSSEAEQPAAVNPVPATPAAAPAAGTKSAKPHPLDKAVVMANESLGNMRANITDYTALMVKRERVNDSLTDRAFMKIKVRNERTTANGKTPFSIYMNFLKPQAQAGREVIWVKGQNGNKLIAHEGSGLMSFKRFVLDPTGWAAMRGNRYPIFEAGIENLTVKLIEKAERDRAAGVCRCEYRTGAMINKRSCTMIEVIHDERRAPFEFHKAEVFIDDELQIPVRYAAYDWPATPGGKPRLIEEYTYVNVKINVGLTDMDFNPNNPAYKYPK